MSGELRDLMSCTVTSSTGCMEWQRHTNHAGYGICYHEGRTVRAHRLAFYLARGYWPTVCRHVCHNPSCINPDHLLDGTRTDNLWDREYRRQEGAGVRPADWRMTHCVHGHELPAVGQCRACNARRQREWRARQAVTMPGRGAPGSASMASSPVSDTGAGAPHEALTGADAQ